jgi:four helix bundle protein
MGDYRKLIVWQDAHELAVEVYRVTKGFPDDEKYGLTAQVRRGSASVAANIAEGSGRGTQKELARFCRIAQGSLNEVEYHVILARDLGYVDHRSAEVITLRVASLRRRLTKFIRSLAPS